MPKKKTFPAQKESSKTEEIHKKVVAPAHVTDEMHFHVLPERLPKYQVDVKRDSRGFIESVMEHYRFDKKEDFDKVCHEISEELLSIELEKRQPVSPLPKDDLQKAQAEAETTDRKVAEVERREVSSSDTF